MRLRLEGDSVVTDEAIHTDVPAIVYAKLIGNLKNQKVEV